MPGGTIRRLSFPLEDLAGSLLDSVVVLERLLLLNIGTVVGRGDPMLIDGDLQPVAQYCLRRPGVF